VKYNGKPNKEISGKPEEKVSFAGCLTRRGAGKPELLNAEQMRGGESVILRKTVPYFTLRETLLFMVVVLLSPLELMMQAVGLSRSGVLCSSSIRANVV
jgi:hypothetical protein